MILAGFLGSGKTTLLLALAKQLLASSLKVAIIENEIGDIGIDGNYLNHEGLQVQELFGGCICCTLTLGLIETINNVEAVYKPDIILIEATGLARPGDLINTMRQYLNRIGSIKTITLVDAERYDLLRNTLAPLFEAQIETADIILLNKIDTVAENQREEITRELAAHCKQTTIVSTSLEHHKNIGHYLMSLL